MNQTKKLHLFLNISFAFLLTFYLSTHLNNPSSTHQLKTLATAISPQNLNYDDENCTDIHNQHGYQAKCFYARSNKGCLSQGYIQYIQVFYCSCGNHPVLGYALFLLWLLLLFYISGNTAANYFCSSLQGLSKVLNLSPTVAGVTLLALGNGASDVFTTIVSFMGSGVSEIGLNGVLGGAFFISSVVVGIISISVASTRVSIDLYSFTRDVVFLVIAVSSLLLIISDGKIDAWNATAYVFLYFLYIFCVITTRTCSTDSKTMDSSIRQTNLFAYQPEEFSNLGIPLLNYVGDEKLASTEKIGLLEDGDNHQEINSRLGCFTNSRLDRYLFWMLYVLQLPLHLPRRMTIPTVCEEKWSKPFAVCSVTLAPLLLAALWNSQNGNNIGSKSGLMVYGIGALAGIVLGTLVYLTIEKCRPPNRCLVIWLLGGFFMSVIWTYIVSNELVAFLVSLGRIIGINPSILAVSVLAWGNSSGDLMANVTMAIKGGEDGAQTAISGCFGGPVFNILVGLGLSFVFASWAEYPSSYTIPKDPYLNLTIGFFLCALLWALMILPRQNMKLGKFLGAGLLSIYFCFMSVRIVQYLGVAV